MCFINFCLETHLLYRQTLLYICMALKIWNLIFFYVIEVKMAGSLIFSYVFFNKKEKIYSFFQLFHNLILHSLCFKLFTFKALFFVCLFVFAGEYVTFSFSTQFIWRIKYVLIAYREDTVFLKNFKISSLFLC